jgi:hypothetical protein
MKKKKIIKDSDEKEKEKTLRSKKDLKSDAIGVEIKAFLNMSHPGFSNFGCHLCFHKRWWNGFDALLTLHVGQNPVVIGDNEEVNGISIP